MKFTISAINQLGIGNAGLIQKTDVVDWCLLDYIYDWQQNPKAVHFEGKVWLSYKHLIEEMPLLGLNDKSSVSKRLKKLKSLNLIDTHQSQADFRLYVMTTPFYYDITKFKILPVDVNQHPLTKVNAPVDFSQHPVGESQHSTVIPINSITNKQIVTTAPENFFENSTLTLTAQQQACFDWAKTNHYWASVTVSIEDFLHVYNKPKGGLRKQFEAYQNSPLPINSNKGANHATSQPAPRKLSAVERAERANPLYEELSEHG